MAPRAMRTPISRVRSRTLTSMTFMTLRPPRKSVAMPTAPMKIFHADDDHAIGFSVFHGVPDAGGFFIARIEVVQARQGAAKLAHAVFVRFERPRSDQQAIDGVFDGGRLIRKIPPHGIERDKDFAGVESRRSWNSGLWTS